MLTTFNYQTGRQEINQAELQAILPFPPDQPHLTIKGPIQVSKGKSIGRMWWSKRWVEVFEKQMPAVYHEGRTMARNAEVLEIYVSPGRLAGVTVDSYGYRATCVPQIHIPVFTNWPQILERFSEQARRTVALLNGTLPMDIEQVFASLGWSFLDFGSTGMVQTCNDRRKPCPHVSALMYTFAELLDSEPALLFHLRGQDKVLDRLRGVAPEPDEQPLSLDNFWLTQPIIEQSRAKIVSQSDVSTISRDFARELKPFYDFAVESAQTLLESFPQPAHTMEKLSPESGLLVVDGLITDARHLPPELRQKAIDQGLIPDITGES